MNLDFRLIKFTNYGDDFVKGKLYLNSLEYYRGIESVINKTAVERNTAINDYREGAVASVNVNDLHKFNINWEKEITDNIVGNVYLLSEILKYVKVLCFYAFKYDKDTHIALAPSKKIYTFGANEAIIITNTNEFLERVKSALDKRKTKIIAANHKFVDYYDDDETTKILGAFNKTADFWWQQEYRFMFIEEPFSLEPTILEIGDISDITIRVPTKDFLGNVLSVWEKHKPMFLC
ncbi:MAG: hypothetical protein IKJ25_00050 [Clostridia bacterium]|nr:hypothetical protein [Clostridia bacterium]